MADLKKMNRKQLERLIADARRALKSIETKEKREAKKAAEKAAAKFGFSLSDLVGAEKQASAGKKKAAPRAPGKPKYANPADPSQVWTGRGRRPGWYTQAVEAGADPASMEI
ncbi:H-NS histone family protein [uncultured Roseobacter sp.]|uniref:H-NS histone family protein n=1 Tax=uncultured Roseobacter sp. TaxID=114847 RepID=UPI00262F833B|nr:H-NS histone family protein [uncultured Roseobacter sp.]